MICPKCNKPLTLINKTYKCLNNHSYDVSKEGYCNLLLSKTNSGDNKDLVNARINFLSKDFYQNLALHLIRIYKTYYNNKNVTICDCGCGTGYYTKKLATALLNNTFYGIDISKEAIKYCAKNDKNSHYIVASNQKIPFENNYFDSTFHIFSPVFEESSNKVLKDDGIMIVVTPGKMHLYELKEMLYSNPYFNKIDDVNYSLFNKIDHQEISYKIDLSYDDFINLLKMTPYYYKTNKQDILKISFTNTISITIDFIISIYNKKTVKPEI